MCRRAGSAFVSALAGALLLAGCGADGGSDSSNGVGGSEPGTEPQSKRSYAPWPGAEHDPRHSSSSPAKGPTSGELLWKRSLEGAVVPGPAVGRDGTIYAASNGGVLHAFGPDGSERWSFDGGSGYGSDLSTTPAITRRGTILWPGPGALFALDPDGDLLWRHDFETQVLSPLLGDDSGGTVYAMEAGGKLTALSTDDDAADVIWTAELGSTSFSSPALGADGTIYAGADASLFAVDPGGDVRWSYETGDLIEVSPAVGPDGTIVIGSNDAMAYGIRPDGSELWSHDLGEITYSSPAASGDGTAYIGDHSGAVKALDLGDGSEIARYAGQGRTEDELSVGVWTAPLIDAEGNVYFGTRLGHVYGFTAAGERLFDVQTGATVDSYPALSAEGTLLIGSEDGNLYAIGDG